MKKVMLLALLMSSQASARDIISIDKFEFDTRFGAADYSESCSSCDIVPSYGLGFSTDKDAAIFLSTMFSVNETYAYESSDLYYDLDSYSFDFSANYNFLQTQDFATYATVGGSYWNNKSIGMNAEGVFSETKSGVSPLVGLGLNYDLGSNVRIGLQYNYKFGMSGDSEFGIHDQDTHAVFFTLSFFNDHKTLNPFDFIQTTPKKKKRLDIDKNPNSKAKSKSFNSAKNNVLTETHFATYFEQDNASPVSVVELRKAIDEINSFADEDVEFKEVHVIGHSNKNRTSYLADVTVDRVNYVKRILNKHVKNGVKVVYDFNGEGYPKNMSTYQRVDILIKDLPRD